MRVIARLLYCFAGTLAVAVALQSADCVAAQVSGYKVIAKYPHSTESYTEGFFYRDGVFYEGTGLKGHSAVLAIQPETGKPIQRLDLPSQYFGEGIVDWGPDIYEWTWQSHLCFTKIDLTIRHSCDRKKDESMQECLNATVCDLAAVDLKEAVPESS